MNSGFWQKQSEAALFSHVVSLIQVLRHWGRTVGQGADGMADDELERETGELLFVLMAGVGIEGVVAGTLVDGATHWVHTVEMLVLVMVDTVVVV